MQLELLNTSDVDSVRCEVRIHRQKNSKQKQPCLLKAAMPTRLLRALAMSASKPVRSQSPVRALAMSELEASEKPVRALAMSASGPSTLRVDHEASESSGDVGLLADDRLVKRLVVLAGF